MWADCAGRGAARSASASILLVCKGLLNKKLTKLVEWWSGGVVEWWARSAFHLAGYEEAPRSFETPL